MAASWQIVLLPELEAVGTIGYAERVWQQETVCERGWSVLPPFQGRGIAAGFSLIGECDFEFPPGHLMRSNDWRPDLAATG
jgi:hypothetical protein